MVLDIGTEFLKVLIFRVEEKHGYVTGYAKLRQRLGDMEAGAVANIAGVIETCQHGIAQAGKMAGVYPRQTIMGIAGELVRGATTTVTYTRETPQVRIDMPELRAIVQRVQARAFNRVRGELSRETGYPEIEVKLVNAAVVDSRIDGQKISNPIGFQGKDVALSIFNSFAPLIHFGALQTIAAELELDVLTIATEPFALARALVPENGTDLSAIFIDVGGGTTDIAVMHSGGDLTTRMFAIGGRTFTKRLAQTMNISFLEAEAVKLDYAKNKVSERKKNLIKKTLEGDLEVWLAGVQLALSEILHNNTSTSGVELPSRIFLCGGGAKLPEIKLALKGAGWVAELPFRERPIVKFVVPDDIKTLTDQSKRLRDIQDTTPLALASLGLELLSEEKVISTVLRKTLKLMKN